MEKVIKNGVIKGYEIGKAISIHSHIADPDSWFITIRPLQIFSDSLCKKDCNEIEIATYVNTLLHKKLDKVNELINDVVLFT